MEKIALNNMGSIEYNSVSGTKFKITISEARNFEESFHRYIKCKLTFEWDRVSNDKLEFYASGYVYQQCKGEISLNQENKSYSCDFVCIDFSKNKNEINIPLSLSIKRKEEVTENVNEYIRNGNLWKKKEVNVKRIKTKVVDATKIELKEILKTLIGENQ